jgi:hypothetical protein
MKVEFHRHIFEILSKIKFKDNPFSGSRVQCGRTDMTLIADFRNFANAPKKESWAMG